MDPNPLNTSVVDRLLKAAGSKSASGLLRSESEGLMIIALEEVLSTAQVYQELLGGGPIDLLALGDALPVKMLGITLENKRCLGAPSNIQRGLPRVEYYQNLHQCLFMDPLKFRAYLQYRFNQFPLTIQAATLLQYWVEFYLIDLYRDAILAATHDKRKTLFPKDLQLVRRLRRSFI